MATSQMNVRIDGAIKSAGDAVFESIGYTPTRVVRILWEYAARCQANPEEVQELLKTAERSLTPSAEDERMRKAKLAERGPHVFEDFLEQMGVREPHAFAEDELSPAEAREQAFVERALQKGWING